MVESSLRRRYKLLVDAGILSNKQIYVFLFEGNVGMSKCPRCGKGYTNVDSLRKHMKYYCGKDKICCSLCPFKTVYAGNMKTHMILKHKPFELVHLEL